MVLWYGLVYFAFAWNALADSEGLVSNDEILTLKEVAQLLKVAEKTVYSMAKTKELPAFKVRGQWRFRREDIHRWIDGQTEQKIAPRQSDD
jgi:excisionase family DNA binding protein